MSDEMEYISLGDTHRLGASAHYVRLGEWGILLDAGLDPEDRDFENLPDFSKLRNYPVNAIIISHAHLDHLGALPLAVRYFPRARIYMTPATAYLSEKMLFHYIQVQRKRTQNEAKKFEPLYTAEEVEQILYLFQSFNYNFPFGIHGFLESDIEITFWDAGHILGSAGIEIKWWGRRFFYTGNTRKSPQFILKGGKYPDSSDILLLESTYGSDEKAAGIKRAAEVRRFSRFLSERIAQGGSVLIPVFALDRTQEMMVLLHRLLLRNKIPAVPIYLTGFGVEINRIYDRMLHKIYPEYKTKRLHTISFDTLRGKKYRKPAVILATSGMMLPNTLSFEIASDFLKERRNGIAFVGWADPDTPGGSLRELKTEKIRSAFQVESVLCEIDVFTFSAHSHREELLAIARQLSPRKTILCHGEEAALTWMEKQLAERNICRNSIVPEKGEAIKL